jgi:hypothetical protein
MNPSAFSINPLLIHRSSLHSHLRSFDRSLSSGDGHRPLTMAYLAIVDALLFRHSLFLTFTFDFCQKAVANGDER